jgi:hypothetical protein
MPPYVLSWVVSDSEATMKVLISGLVGVSFLAALATAADAAPRAKTYRYHATQGGQGHNPRSVDRGNGYYERLADKLPFGSSIWWEQMMRERRGGRPG